MVAIERSTVREREKRAEEEEKERLRKEEDARRKVEIEETKEKLENALRHASECLQVAHTAAMEAEAPLEEIMITKGSSLRTPVSFTNKSGKLSAAEMKVLADDAETILTPATTALEEATKDLTDLTVVAPIDGYPNGFKYGFDKFMNTFRTTQAYAINVARMAASTRDRAVRMVRSEMEALRITMMSLVSDYMRAKSMKTEELYSHFGGTPDGITCEKFVACIAEAHEHIGDKLDDGRIARCEELFRHIASSNHSISKEKFFDLIGFVYRVAQATMLSEGHAIASKPLRRLEEGELVKGFDLPITDDESGLSRLHCHATKDGAEGWVSLSGNKGTVFLELYGSFQTCAKETIMTDSLPMSSKPVKRLNKDEVIEVLEFPTKDEHSGVMRLRGQVVNGGKCGWVNISRGGTIFLEAC